MAVGETSSMRLLLRRKPLLVHMNRVPVNLKNAEIVPEGFDTGGALGFMAILI
jgi:hypothetical protein